MPAALHAARSLQSAGARKAFQHPPRFRHDLSEFAARDRTFDANDQIQSGKRRAAFSHHDAKHAAHTIAIDGPGQRLAADHEPDSPARALRGRRYELKKFAFAAPAGPENRLERACTREPAAATCRGHRRNNRQSGCEPGAALRATGRKHLAAADALHSGAKAVRTLAVDDRGLERAFHGGSLEVKKPYIRAR